MTWEDAGRATNWEEYEFEIQKLYVHWRDAERDIREIRAWRHADYIKAMMTAPQNSFLPPAG